MDVIPKGLGETKKSLGIGVTQDFSGYFIGISLEDSYGLLSVMQYLRDFPNSCIPTNLESTYLCDILIVFVTLFWTSSLTAN